MSIRLEGKIEYARVHLHPSIPNFTNPKIFAFFAPSRLNLLDFQIFFCGAGQVGVFAAVRWGQQSGQLVHNFIGDLLADRG